MAVDKIGINGISGLPDPGKVGSNKDSNFAEILKDSIDKVNQLQLNAESAMEKLSNGEVKDVHEVLVAVEEANLAFMTMIQIRNKLVEAYQELMRLQM